MNSPFFLSWVRPTRPSGRYPLDNLSKVFPTVASEDVEEEERGGGVDEVDKQSKLKFFLMAREDEEEGGMSSCTPKSLRLSL